MKIHSFVPEHFSFRSKHGARVSRITGLPVLDTGLLVLHSFNGVSHTKCPFQDNCSFASDLRHFTKNLLSIAELDWSVFVLKKLWLFFLIACDNVIFCGLKTGYELVAETKHFSLIGDTRPQTLILFFFFLVA